MELECYSIHSLDLHLAKFSGSNDHVLGTLLGTGIQSSLAYIPTFRWFYAMGPALVSRDVSPGFSHGHRTHANLSPLLFYEMRLRNKKIKYCSDY